MFVLQSLRWQSLVDFAVLFLVVFWLLRWSRATRVLRIFIGIGGLLLAGFLAGRVELVLTAWMFHLAALTAVALLIVVYHAEIRHALAHLDLFTYFTSPFSAVSSSSRSSIARAVFSMASARLGALLVIPDRDALDHLLTGGMPLGGTVSKEILEAIFQKESPVHDGAVVIEKDRIVRVGAFLPLSTREDLPNYFGTRHRAAVGLAEQSDAKILVVSEERGAVSLITGRTITQLGTAPELIQKLEKLKPQSPVRFLRRLHIAIFQDLRLKVAAFGIACLVWGLFFMAGSSLRSYAVPIEFKNVPAGLEIAEPSNPILAVRLRANTHLFSTLDESRLLAQVDLKGRNAGTWRIPLSAQNLNLPPGFILEQVLPASFTLRLVLQKDAAK
jgi:uncharacterized protein (TIGR00159 family)